MGKLRYIDLGKLGPSAHVALHEWNRTTAHGGLMLLTHTTSELLVVANILPLDQEFRDLPDGLPVRRFYIPRKGPGSALFTEGTLAIHFTHPTMDLQACRDAFSACLLRAVRSFGVWASTREGTNDYYIEVGGAEKKFAGHYALEGAGQTKVGATISFEFDNEMANRVFDLKSDKIRKKGDITDMAQVVGGLHDLLPGVTADDVAQAFVTELSKRFGVEVERSELSEQERKSWRVMERAVSSDDWIRRAVCPKELR